MPSPAGQDLPHDHGGESQLSDLNDDGVSLFGMACDDNVVNCEVLRTGDGIVDDVTPTNFDPLRRSQERIVPHQLATDGWEGYSGG